MTNGFKDQTAMNKFIVRLMPTVNGAEGRQLVRELETAGTMGDQKIVVRRCVEIVLETQSPANRAASAAVPRRRPSGQSPSPAAPAVPTLLSALSSGDRKSVVKELKGMGFLMQGAKPSQTMYMCNISNNAL